MKKLSVINKQFIEAAKSNQIDVLKNLLSQGANIHANNDEALRWAANYGELEVVKFLRTEGANIHANDGEALKRSYRNGYYDVWQLLSAFIQEEKLLVAASDSMLVLPAVASVALVAALGSVPRRQPAKLKKFKRSKI